MTKEDKEQLNIEISHIFESGANHLRIFEMVENFIDKRYKAINYTRCCEELKDKEKISFDEWLKVEDIKMHQDGTFYISSERRYVELTFLINRYNSLNL
jgi:hypothetical protein